MVNFIMVIGIGLILFGLVAGMATSFYDIFFGAKVTTVAMYYESLIPYWPIKISIVGLMVSAVALLLFIPISGNQQPKKNKSIDFETVSLKHQQTKILPKEYINKQKEIRPLI